MTDRNVELIQKAIETKTEIILIPRRSHTVKGIPLEFDKSTLRVYVDTGKNIESILISEVGHFSFPKNLYDQYFKEESEHNKQAFQEFRQEKEKAKAK